MELLDQRKSDVTGGQPRDRFGTVVDVAAAVVYLAGPSASYITGTELTVDGGHAA
jgi:NAD(P)-dependent dehydrogenase (short-subunit alcohol dehydrogenase family)